MRLKGKYASETFETKVEANYWAAEKEQYFGKNGGIVTGKTLKDAFDRYAKEISPSKKGHRWEVIRLEKISRHSLADIFLTQLTPDDLRNWISDSNKTVAASSTRRELILISAVIEAARKTWKWIESNPCREVEFPKSAEPRDRRISTSETDKILKALDHKERQVPSTPRQNLAIAFLLALETAMRQSEIWSLKWENTFLYKRYVTLPITKNGTKRDVPLSKKAVALLKLLGPKETGRVLPSSQNSAAVLFRKAVKECKIKDLTFHDTRHESLTRLARKIDVLDLARMVGHRDPRSLMIYYNATASEIAGRLD